MKFNNLAKQFLVLSLGLAFTSGAQAYPIFAQQITKILVKQTADLFVPIVI